MIKPKFQRGDIVHYHSVIGREHNGRRHVVREIQRLEDGRHVYWLTGKSGFVSEEALSLNQRTALADLKLRVEMVDGAKWDVPVVIIALDRARSYRDEFATNDANENDGEGGAFIEDTVPLFLASDFEIIDWAANNMNWADVAQHATQVNPPEPFDFDEGWVNGPKEVIRG